METIKSNLTDLDKLAAERKRIGENISVNLEIITPDTASRYLAMNLNDETIKNRKINEKTVNLYVKDIINDRWKIGAPIIFDSNNHMIDGQTRCSAVVKAKKPILSLVIRGVDPSNFNILDCGKKRTHKDVLSSLIVNGKVLDKPASVSSGINVMLSVLKNYKSVDKSWGHLTNPEIYEKVKEDFNYYNHPFKYKKIQKWRKRINSAIRENIITAFYYIHKKNDGDNVDTFLDIITSNDDNTPMIVRKFRDMVNVNKSKKSDDRGYLAPSQIYKMIEILYRHHNSKNGLDLRKNFTKTEYEKIME